MFFFRCIINIILQNWLTHAFKMLAFSKTKSAFVIQFKVTHNLFFICVLKVIWKKNDFALYFLAYICFKQIIEYENRVRAFSTADKVFRYFATIQVPHPHGEYEVFMTPVDFLTSMSDILMPFVFNAYLNWTDCFTNHFRTHHQSFTIFFRLDTWDEATRWYLFIKPLNILMCCRMPH